MAEKRLHFNGVNGATGAPLLDPMTADQWVAWIKGENKHQPITVKNILRVTWEKLRKKVMGTIHGVDALDLKQARWGIIYHPGTSQDVRDSLKVLVDYRDGEKLCYDPGSSAYAFRKKYGQGPGVVNPKNLPYYLLIVGPPTEIPFRFQYDLDAEHAVGRICFEDAARYAAYAKSVCEYEDTSGALPRERRVAFFSTANDNDEATARSDLYLAHRLAQALNGKPLTTLDGKPLTLPGGAPLSYRTEHTRGADAKRQKLVDLLTRTANQPALLFTATHGLGFPKGHSLQRTDQGALVCGEWSCPVAGAAPTGLTDKMYLAGRHLSSAARFDGLVVFSYACYSAGTPHLEDFSHFGHYKPQEIAPSAFVAALPRRLLAQGALAFAGHVDRAWDYSFLWSNVSNHTDTFQSTLEAILSGVPLGHAFEFFNRRYLDLNNLLTGSQADSLLKQYQQGYIEPIELADTWTARNDARAYVLYGDPAIRLKPELLSPA